MSSSASTQKTAPSLDDGLHTASEGGTGLSHHGPVQAAAVLLDGVDQGGLCGVSTSVGMCLQVAPDKIVHRVEVRAARRPGVLGDKVVGVLLQPPDGPVGSDRGLSPAARPRACLQ